MRVVLVVTLCAVALGGCLTRANQERELSEADAKEDAFCRSVGAKPGSDAYVSCRTGMRQSLIQKHAAETARSRSDTTCVNTPGVGVTCF